MAALTYISLFSGIGSCALASRDLGWTPIAFAEVEPFASAVLEHRFPNVPNVGDVTAYDWSRFRRQVDLVCGGPPCQPFSVAGDRGSLNDARGNLSLEYINAIDAIDPRFSLTENVPGWLSTKDNAFGVFLGKLVGSDSPLVPGRGQRWTNAGVATGPKRLAAWRILDAQHYGVPQRRRRVFVLTVRIGDRFSPEQILFESESLSGNPPPLRGASENIAGTLGGGTSGGGPKPDTDRMTFLAYPIDTQGQTCDTADRAAKERNARDLLYSVFSTDREDSQSEWASRTALRVQEKEVLLQALFGDSLQREGTGGESGVGDVSPESAEEEGSRLLRTMWSLLRERRPSPERGLEGQLPRQPRADLPELSQSGTPEAAQTLLGVRLSLSQVRVLRQALSAVQKDRRPFTDQARTQRSFIPMTAGCLQERDYKGTDSDTKPGHLIVEATSFKASHYTRDKDGAPSTVVPPLSADADKGDQDTLILAPWSALTSEAGRTGKGDSAQCVAGPSMQVRRLTPLECERLQGEPDFWTLVPYRGKPASDSVRYRAIGNAWAIPVLEWIFRRLDLVDKCLELDQRQPVRSQEVDTHTSQASDERGRVPAGKGRCVD